jgi:replicative DNA helicase
MNLKDYPEKLIQNREKIEASFIFCLWKEPDLYDDYLKLKCGEDGDIKTEDGMFYFALGMQMYQNKYKNFDNVSIDSFLENKKVLKDGFNNRGGYRSVEEIRSLLNIDNIDAYYDEIAKNNYLIGLYDKGFNVLQNFDKFSKMTTEQVYDWYDYQINNLSLSSGNEIQIETLEITDEELEQLDNGEAMGIPYNRVCKILSYLTMGLPLGDMYMFGGHSGIGKTSFVFENIILPVSEDGIKTGILSNEQRSKDFKLLLLIHILTQELNYWEITRKKLKMGKFTAEQKSKIKQAQAIQKQKYSHIKFVKLFDNNMNNVKKIIKKLSKVGYQVFLFDTMKSEDTVDEAMWQQLLLHSRKLFQLASKENISLITTYQLALSTLNKRYLDAGCLSNCKQLKEVFSEMVYARPLWSDEYTGQKYDVKAYNIRKDENGKYTKIHDMVDLDPNKKYVIAFLDKTRNDEDKQTVLYEFNGRFNKWTEIGYCNVENDHK